MSRPTSEGEPLTASAEAVMAILRNRLADEIVGRAVAEAAAQAAHAELARLRATMTADAPAGEPTPA